MSPDDEGRKLWLGDRGVLQPRFVGVASDLSADEQFAGWQHALPPLRTPAQERAMSPDNKGRKLWLGDRGVLQSRFVGTANDLSADEQFAGWQHALPPKRKRRGRSPRKQRKIDFAMRCDPIAYERWHVHAQQKLAAAQAAHATACEEALAARQAVVPAREAEQEKQERRRKEKWQVWQKLVARNGQEPTREESCYAWLDHSRLERLDGASDDAMLEAVVRSMVRAVASAGGDDDTARREANARAKMRRRARMKLKQEREHGPASNDITTDNAAPYQHGACLRVGLNADKVESIAKQAEKAERIAAAAVAVAEGRVAKTCAMYEAAAAIVEARQTHWRAWNAAVRALNSELRDPIERRSEEGRYRNELKIGHPDKTSAMAAVDRTRRRMHKDKGPERLHAYYDEARGEWLVGHAKKQRCLKHQLKQARKQARRQARRLEDEVELSCPPSQQVTS